MGSRVRVGEDGVGPQIKWVRKREWIPDISGEVRGKNMSLLRARARSAIWIIHKLCAGVVLGADSFNSSPVFRV